MASLELTDEQLTVVSKACELMSRIYMGQLKEIAWLFGDLPEASYQELFESLKSLNSVVTNLPSQAHFSIRDERVPDMGRVAYDIHQVIRHYLAWKQQPSGGYGVTFDSPNQYGQEPLPKIE